LTVVALEAVEVAVVLEAEVVVADVGEVKFNIHGVF
jgi:hypothetical protein